MEPEAAGSRSGTVLVDGHVHLYRCFHLGRFLSHAFANLHQAAEEPNGGESTTRVDAMLVLLDSDEGDPRERLMREPRVRETQEHGSALVADGGRTMAVVGGRQIRTRERLEVLAVPSSEEFRHGRELEDTIREVLDAGAVPVVPWAFGKWWLRRGRIVRELLNSELGPQVLLGDNGTRPRRAPPSLVFREAGRLQRPILPGSDPLPLQDHEGRAGSYGFALPGPIDRDRPARWLLQQLRSLEASPPAFGARMSLFECLDGNVRLRMPSGGTRSRRPRAR